MDKIQLYLKPTALRFHFQPWPTIYTNLTLAVFPSLVWNKHRIFLRSAESQLFWIDLAMLLLVMAWTTTQSRKQHGETLDYCTKKNYIQLFTTEMWYLQIFVRFRLNKREKTVNLRSWNGFHSLCNMTLRWSEPSWAEIVMFRTYEFCTKLQDNRSGPIFSIFGISDGKIGEKSLF